MNTSTKLGAYALGLAALFAGAAVVGDVAGPAPEKASERTAAHNTHGGAGPDDGAGHGGGGQTAAPVPGGLQVSQGGYTLAPKTVTLEPGKKTDFAFSVNGPDGRPVTRYTTIHGKQLHLIVVRRDMSGFQHLHPVVNGAGVWTIPLTLPDPGAYRMFTDVQPEGVKEQFTLGADLTAPGDHRPADLPEPVQVAKVDDYEVRLAGALQPGRTSRLTLSVAKDGEPVTDLEPYLEAYGHLVALRSGDLAYLHVHPDGEPGDGRTRPGPEITFYAEVPSVGTYRLYLDFQHEGKVRTAEFTVVAGGASAPQQPATGGGGHGDDGHAH
ncbi:hypothetical protein [Thermomonospora umbrina]|uniref:Secreted protein n=1 Tax=Thermomonospora umbrina TaxID=111806 RepID=A0A3D9SXV6_9ACTN|nr:hypothetical protein [Thermomonospora umbrina]REE97394.1 hypothetical protein DFJ69_2862 [Thermomonospora umbrina]